MEFHSAQAESLGLPPLPVYQAPGTPDSRFPLTLAQGRTLAHFHGFYDNGRALPTLARHDPEPSLWMAPADAQARGLEHGAPIRIHNARGSFEARAHLTDKMPPGVVWMRDGWIGLNRLTGGDSVLPVDAVDLFPHFSAGQASFEARVEVEGA